MLLRLSPLCSQAGSGSALEGTLMLSLRHIGLLLNGQPLIRPSRSMSRRVRP